MEQAIRVLFHVGFNRSLQDEKMVWNHKHNAPDSVGRTTYFWNTNFMLMKRQKDKTPKQDK